MSIPEWSDPAHVARYRERLKDEAWAVSADQALLEQVPSDTRRILDLGSGDGRVLALLLAGRPERTGLGLDNSPLMLAAARERFATEPGAEVLEHDLSEALPELGSFDAVVSSLAIHHLEDARKRSLYEEAFAVLEPGGMFANFEHVASPSERLHHEFFAAIDEPLDCEDPSDRLLDVETQLRWLRAIGFEEVDCQWKWRELALIVGRKPARRDRPAARRPEIVVRASVEQDWPAIWGFLGKIAKAGETIAYAREMSEEQARAMWLAEPPGRTSVALDADEVVVGSANMHANRAGPGGHVASATYIVDPIRQGEGFGRALVLDSLDWARAQGFRAMQFNAVVEGNRPALALYESLGFAIVGTVPDAFEHPRKGLLGLHVMHRAI